MANCCSCSAPLPSDTSRCSYCGTRNDMDFAVTNRFAAFREESGRQCPLCQINLQSIRLTPDGAFVIERCKTCYGLFFDPGEVQAFLEASEVKAFDVNFKELVNINRERTNKDRQVRYIKCPECGKFMNRVNFGYRSGVVMDQCKPHGVWLDNGELIQLMEWKKAGGQLLDEQKKTEQLQKQAQPAGPSITAGADAASFAGDGRMENPPGDPVRAAFSLLSKLFG